MSPMTTLVFLEVLKLDHIKGGFLLLYLIVYEYTLNKPR